MTQELMEASQWARRVADAVDVAAVKELLGHLRGAPGDAYLAGYLLGRRDGAIAALDAASKAVAELDKVRDLAWALAQAQTRPVATMSEPKGGEGLCGTSC